MDELHFGGGSPIRRAVGSAAFGADVVGDLQSGVEKFGDEVLGTAAIGCVGWPRCG